MRALCATLVLYAVSAANGLNHGRKLRDGVQGLVDAAAARVGRPRASVASVIAAPGSGGMKVTRGRAEGAAAWGSFADGIEDTGWGELTIHTSDAFEDGQQAYAAGLLEGYLTHRRIRDMAANIASTHDKRAEDGLRRYFQLQRDYLDSKAREVHDGKVDDSSGFWHHAGLVWRQFEGVVKGYNRYCGEGNELDAFQIWLLNMDGDNIELEQAITRGAVPLEGGGGGGDEAADSDDPMSGLLSRADEAADGASEHLAFRESEAGLVDGARAEQAPAVHEDDVPGAHERTAREEREWARKMRKSRCSALVKLLPETADLLVAHTSWEDYVEMMRVFKHYHFAFRHPATKARTVSFSSYPGMVSSTDDWYVTDAGLLITETTVNLMNNDLFARMKPQSLGSWVRAMVASRLAAAGPQWAALYARENSGTYNCHWMIVDYNKVKPGSPLPDNTFYVVETIPGLAVGDDMTAALRRRTYWPSVNRPFFRRVREAAGYPLHDRLVDGVDFLSFERNPRGHQLAQLHHTVQGSSQEALAAMKRLIRHNDPAHDKSQRGKPSYAVAARYDLMEDAERTAMGATDAKVAGLRDVRALRTHAQCGPTTEDGNAPFSFTGEWAPLPHQGLPGTFDFPWRVMQPR